jgi:hypothetical protein
MTNGYARNNQVFEPHRNNPRIYRYIYCSDETVGGRVLDFDSNYQLIAEPHNLVVKEMGKNLIDYLKKDCALTFGPGNIPQFKL